MPAAFSVFDKYHMRDIIDIISEASNWVTTIKTNTWDGSDSIEVFKNPSKADLKRLGEGGMVRALISMNGDILYFEDGFLHSEVLYHLDCKTPHLIFDNKGNVTWNELESYRIDEQEPDFREVRQYYVSALATDWTMLKTNPNILRITGPNLKILGVDENQEFVIDDEWIAAYATGDRKFN